MSFIPSNIPRKGSITSGGLFSSPGVKKSAPSFRELSPDEVEDRVAGDIEMHGGNTDGTPVTRRRADTVVLGEDLGVFSGIVSNNWIYNINKFAAAVYISIFNRLQFYLKITPVIVILLAVGGQAKASTVILGLTTREWITFLAHILSINAVAAICEIVVFLSMELFLSSNYDFVYCFRALQGPLGHIATIGVMVNFYENVKLPNVGYGWGGVSTVLLTVLLFSAWKSFQLRKYYLSILKNRLASKLEMLAKKKSILSVLATTTRSATTPSTSYRRMKSRADSMDTDQTTANNNVFTNINNVFREIVNEANENFSHDLTEEEEVAVQTSFWTSLNSKHRTLLLQGAMMITTVSGEVVIRDKKTAIRLGKQLYAFLSKNGTRAVSSASIGDVIRNSLHLDTRTAENTVSVALEMFHCLEEATDHLLSEQDIVYGVKQVYRSMKYAAGSFSDLQELNQSVLVIVDVIFWICMFLVAQLILQLDTATLLAPILTIIFGASFAFATMLSNLLTAVTFVLFICPYDVGHRVILGYGSGQYAKGNILTVNLFYTTMITNYNEKLVIPNHVLFNERIINLAESKFATFDVQLGFCADGPHAVSRNTIDEFLRRVKDYMMVEQKGEWKDVDFYCIGYDVPNNVLQYSIWSTHEGGWAEVTRTLGARTKLWEFLHVLKTEMNIKFMKLAESRQLDWNGRGPAIAGFNGAGVPMPPANNDTSFNYGGATGLSMPPAHTADSVVRTNGSPGDTVEKEAQTERSTGAVTT